MRRGLLVGGLLAVVLVASSSAVFRALDQQRKRQADPCRHEPVGVLAERYPALQELLDRQDLQVDLLDAEQKKQDAVVEYRLKRGTMTDVQAAEFKARQAERLGQLVERQLQDFDRLCRRLVGR